mmetsp:Transcript_11166/g.25967  ORF Transcript_11166/g.25967 Transcript_11166/m.25967 type:complete len:599 (+) Transcript_11166:120-1916(+)|eukprot:CAMPEP_0201119752 /NCGR_PEP_ID=MMETSP0850-20130426/3862_1 /ASSEMBLY_ACC=CAM_ASM_000622 /TAXON_ID=183588 /ORGANISM="Pseudo-nitzschia fraudulenta, Strain WWA7" /LENGTH=598 /DNA_ID=CAMNT_0047385599 /DNA_START=15 /DNA_END=1808 /DNA_ORIENTATION=-
MNENKVNLSNNRVKFAPLVMDDQFRHGDHRHDDFNYRSQLQTADSDDDAAIAVNNSTASELSVDPHAHGLGGDLNSAVLGIVKGMVGPAILYLPHGFAQAGWVIAVPMLFASTALYLASSASLLECWKIETKIIKRLLEREGGDVGGDIGNENHAVLEMKELKRSNSGKAPSFDASVGSNTLGEDFDNEFLEGSLVAEYIENNFIATSTRSAPTPPKTASYPNLAKKAYGSWGQTIVKIGIAAMQSGVCLTYLIFVPQNMKSSCRDLFHVNISTSFFLFLMVVVQIPLSWIRDIRHLTVTNALANGLILYGLITCLGFAFQNAIIPMPEAEEENGEQDDNDDVERDPLAELFYKFFHLTAFNSSGWFLFIGTSVLLFEGSITLLIPLQEAVAAPRDRQYFPKMYPNVILCIIWFYTFFGIFCWMSFGNQVHTVMTTSLPENSHLATTVQLAYSVAVMLTFPLQNFPSLEIACTAIETYLLKKSATDRVRGNNMLFSVIQFFQHRQVLSSLLVCALALVAALTMERLDKVVSLMGGLLGCPLAFVFPPMIHNKLASMTLDHGADNGYNLSDSRRLQNKIVATLGFCAMIVATIATILKW